MTAVAPLDASDLPVGSETSQTEIDVRPTPAGTRPQVRGKFLFLGDQKLWIRGVTYGTFAPSEAGDFPVRAQVQADFASMAAAGINSIRVYTVPPRWLLDEAARCRLLVMVGLPWEQHLAFLDRPGGGREILGRLQAQLAPCIGHPALLCYAVGNEIPASVVRWLGRRRVEAFLKSMTAEVRRLDPTALVTYVNFPTTEYLELPFVDFLAFNVYLEDRETLTKYLARLQNLAGERPLLMAEVGLDSRRNGEAMQAESLRWQIETSFAMGCCGAFMFAWTDEWWRGGHEIDDWDFGLTRRDRTPKPALAAVSEAFANVPFRRDRAWPRISVVVCCYNGALTLEETLAGLAALDYPNYEVIVVNDGSTDATPQIASRFDVRLVSTENRGLSAARNTGMELATGEIVAYIDDDAYPDPDWLTFLAAAFERSDHAAMGGPNIAPYEDNDIAECVANAPGGPLHVLVGDELAEHIPGCNMAYRRDKLMAVGGFDPQFRVAGDDVDVCWKIQARGWTLGFCAAAMVWHHRRPSVSRYLKQQRGYAKAEALLAAKWPDKYNSTGHMSWHGRIYGRGLIQTLFPVQRVYHGSMGAALFQSIYHPAPGLLASLPLMPEWYAIVAGLSVLALLGLSWAPLLLFAPLALFTIGATAYQAARGAMDADFRGRELTPQRLWSLRRRTAWLHLLQPLARLQGRIEHGIGPWRRGQVQLSPMPRTRVQSLWSETWAGVTDRLEQIRARAARRTTVGVGGDFDTFDLTVNGGLLGSVRAKAMIEEHGAGRQLLRLTSWPCPSRNAVIVSLLLLGLSGLALWDQAWLAGAVLAALSLATAIGIFSSCAAAAGHLAQAVEDYAAEAGLVSLPGQ